MRELPSDNDIKDAAHDASEAFFNYLERFFGTKRVPPTPDVAADWARVSFAHARRMLRDAFDADNALPEWAAYVETSVLALVATDTRASRDTREAAQRELRRREASWSHNDVIIGRQS